MAVDAVIYIRIFDATMATVNVSDAYQSTRLLAATTLRNVLGTRNMAELLTDRESIAANMQVINGAISELHVEHFLHGTEKLYNL